MASLTNPINAQNIINRFSDYVTATANSGISWGTDSKPFDEMSSDYFGGTTSGKSIESDGSSINSNPINASTIYNTLVTETNTYTRIRNLRAVLFVTGAGGNTGTRPTAGTVYDSTAVANMNTNYLQSTADNTNNAGVSSGSAIAEGTLETFFSNLRAAYNSARDSTTTIQIDVCHASCHSSCHSSRGRR